MLLTAFQAVAEDLINIPGFFNIIVPPYYLLTVGDNEEQKVYLREKSDLPQWCARKIFIPRIEIKAHYAEHLGIPDRVLSEEDMVVFTELLFNYGMLIDNISARLQIMPEILEALCRCTHYLTPETMDVDIVRTALRADKVVYEADTNTITVSYLDEDIPIPLIFVREELYGDILGMLRRLEWNHWIPLLTTKRTDRCKDTPVTFYRLYSYFKKWRDELITIKPLKGLGSMTSLDLTRTCMDPRNRKSIAVNGSGDVRRIIRLMERDTSERKKLAGNLIGTSSEVY